MEKGRNLRSVNTDGGVNLQFKLLSAIGIIIIVSGHCYHGGMELAYNWFPPYSYNLALFVFISGYFYKTDYEENVGNTYGNEQSGFLFLRICGIYFTVVWLHFSVCLDLL